MKGQSRASLWLAAGLFILSGLSLAACDQFMPPPPPPVEASLTPVAPATIASTSSPVLPSEAPKATATPSSIPSLTPQPATGTVTLTPLPGSPTLSPTITRTGTQTKIPTVTPWWTPLPTRTNTITLTPTPQPAYLRFLRPGAFSKVLSPLQLEAGVTPGEDGLVLLELVGEDGRMISQQRLNYSEYLNRSIAIAPKVVFSIPGVAETARLKLSVKDKYGRTMALSSLDLVLFSIGANDFFPASEQIAPYLIRLPFPDQIVTGGILQVRGLVRPVNANPVIFELLDEQGQVLSSGKLNIGMPSGVLSHTPFEIDLAYKVPKSTQARLVVRQESASRIPGTVELWSVPVLLEP